jgi:hypothetical protein
MKKETIFREKRLVPIVRQYEKRIGCTFKPNSTTYLQLGINRKRLGLLISGEAKKPLQVDELPSIATFFGVTVSDILTIQ